MLGGFCRRFEGVPVTASELGTAPGSSSIQCSWAFHGIMELQNQGMVWSGKDPPPWQGTTSTVLGNSRDEKVFRWLWNPQVQKGRREQELLLPPLLLPLPRSHFLFQELPGEGPKPPPSTQTSHLDETDGNSTGWFHPGLREGTAAGPSSELPSPALPACLGTLRYWEGGAVHGAFISCRDIGI